MVSSQPAWIRMRIFCTLLWPCSTADGRVWRQLPPSWSALNSPPFPTKHDDLANQDTYCTFEVIFWICCGEMYRATPVPSLTDKALKIHMEMQQGQRERNYTLGCSSHRIPCRSKCTVFLWCPSGVPVVSRMRKLPNAQIQSMRIWTKIQIHVQME